MKLTKKNMLLISFMLFSLFFGAGNLIFPPFLGANSGTSMPVAIFGFIFPAVVLPVLGVITIAKFNGLDKLGYKVHPIFAIVFTIIIFLSIGPGLGIPRAASVPFEMAIKPYLKADSPFKLYMVLYSFIFFLIALWLALSPKKLLNRIGHVLTPSLLFLICFIFIAFLIKGEVNIVPPTPLYANSPFLVGFIDGYQTMDTIAALNFGFVISGTLTTMGITENKNIVKHTVKAGIAAGSILMLVYIMLAYIGMASSGVYPGVDNGATILRNIVYQLFGNVGAFIVAALFTLACLTTCVGLITSISQYFSTVTKKINYKAWVFIITIVSFLICNLGLNMILSISIPILNAIYPVSIMLIMLGLFDFLYKDNKIIYPLTIASVGVISIIHAIDLLINEKVFISFLTYLPGYELGFGWVLIALAAIIISISIDLIIKHNKKKKDQQNNELETVS